MWCLSSAHLSRRLLFPFWGFTVWENQDDPVGVSMINSHTTFGSKSISPLRVPYMKLEAWSLLPFRLSCFFSQGWSSSEPSWLSSAMCWTLSKPCLSTPGRSEINFLSVAEAISPLLERYSFLCVHPHLPHTQNILLTRIHDPCESFFSA